jgi:hypothetical protein
VNHLNAPDRNTKPVNANAEDKADQLIERTASLLKEAREALDAAKQRAPLDSRNRASLYPTNSPPPTARPEVTTLQTTSVPSRPTRLSWSPASGLDSWFTEKLEPEHGVKSSIAGPQNQMPASPTPPPMLLERDPSIPSFLQFKVDSTEEENLSLAFESQLISQSVAPKEEKEEKVKRSSGESFGPNGYWYRWTEIEGVGDKGEQWFERWWEASDWGGTRELGASKWGVTKGGDAWRETWREALIVDVSIAPEPIVEREAHKWARKATAALGASQAQEWEEKWHEKYWNRGKTEKSADKWGRQGDHIWHERWGESYDGVGGCLKWTDRWAETGGGSSKWGDKWEERFASGNGTKQGETWSESDGKEYHRWWGENHFGDGRVQKFGHSTEGEHWDVTEPMDTYYNPIPHFGYAEALQHSPQLQAVAMLPRDEMLTPSKNEKSALDAFFGGE